MTKNSITLKEITKQYRHECVIDNVSVTMQAGMIHGLIGSNGSGKSMLMKIICGLVTPDSGEVIVNDKIVGKDIEFPDCIGALIEAPGFLSYKSGFNNLKYLASINHTIDDKKISETMRQVGLEPELRKAVGKYSLGMKQRLGIAQAIMEDKEILLLDEPMNGLDKSGIKDMRALMLSLKENGKTIVLASHNQADIDELCDTVYEMDQGTIVKVR